MENFSLAADANVAENILFSVFAGATARIPAIVAKVIAKMKSHGDSTFVEYHQSDSMNNISVTTASQCVSISNPRDFQGDNKVMQTPILQAKVVAALEAEGLSAAFRLRTLSVMGAECSIAEGSYWVRLYSYFSWKYSLLTPYISKILRSRMATLRQCVLRGGRLL